MNRIIHKKLLFRYGEGARVLSRFKAMAFVVVMFLMMSFVNAQNSDVFYILGNVTNEVTGEPVQYQLLFIESDSSYDIPEYFYAEISTNENGFYKVSIPRPEKAVDFFVYTYDCYGQLHDTILHLGEGFISPDQKFYVDFEVCETQLLNCEPNFYFEYDSSTNESGNYLYNFIDASGDNVSTWKWDFGDGTEMFGQNPVHVYENLGVYEVQLTIQSADIFGNGCTDSITKLVNVGGFNYYYLAGQVFKPDYFPFEEEVKVYLYKIENEEIFAVDTTEVQEIIGSNNEIIYAYAFHFLIEGDYMVKAQLTPNSEYYGEFIPTYYGDEIFWQDAEVIHHVEDNDSYDINIVPSYDYIPGEGHINGNISFFNEFSENQPALDVELVLSDSDGNFIKYDYSNHSGEFRFDELPHGLYNIYPDLTGFSCEPFDVLLDEDSPVADSVVIVLNEADTNTAVEEITSEYIDAISSVYPNPVRDMARIDISLKESSNFDIYIYNQIGQKLFHRHYMQASGEYSLPLDLSDMPKGYYTLQLISEDKVSFTAKIIKAY